VITKIEPVGDYRGDFNFISSRDRVEADGTKTFFPGMTVKWQMSQEGELYYDITEAADQQVEMLVNQALLPYDEKVMEEQKKRIIELFTKALPKWQAFREGKVREYISLEEKKKLQAKQLLEQADPDVMELALEMKQSKTEKTPDENLQPIV